MFSPRSRILLPILLLGLLIPGGCSEQSPLTPPTAQAPFTIDKAAPAGYYDTVDTSTPAAMRSSLHAIIDDGIKIPYTATSTDTWDVQELACEDPNNSGQVLDIYLNAVYPKYGGGNDFYNREHSWPKSFGFPNDGSTNYPYTDCHHLFICNSGYNSSRSNKPYGTAGAAGTEKTTLAYNGVGGGSGVYPGWSNWYDSTYWETWQDRRGDVARALLYMDVRYEGGIHPGTSNPEPDLILTDDLTLIENSNTGANESVAYMGLLSVLLQWSQDDPVDAKEMAHNDAVYSFQGNRNPFVDHPEWIDCVFGSTCGGGGGGGDPATAWINEFHYDNDGTDTGEFFEIAGTAGLDLAGWTLYAYNGNGGTVYNTVNLSGVLADQQSGFGTLAFNLTGMQNGSPDGLALVDGSGSIVMFISYEGALTATDGPASGLTSTDVGVSETSTTTVGHSLQLGGSGSAYADFSWQAPQANTSGAVNTGQSFSGGPVNQAPTAVANGPYSGQMGMAVSFSSAGSSDPDGIIVSYAWDFGDGGTSTAANPTHTYTTTGTFNVTLTVTDDLDATAGDVTTATITGTTLWINELHYDNDGTDTGEFFEIAGPSGTVLTGWTVYGYNGNGGTVYATVNLSGTMPAQMGGFGTLAFAMTGMQNGSPDGLALTDASGDVIQFISYEGSFVATDGAASGMTADDIGVSETSTTTVGYSLQLGGSGSTYGDFTWQTPAANTSGAVNTGQTLGDGAVSPTADFSSTSTSGTAPLTVTFTDLSSGSPTSWSWDFGDGSTSTAQNPGYTYTAAGTYTVTLIAGNGTGSDTKTRTGYITVDSPPVGGWTTITYDDFEGGMGNYRDGGSDMKRYSGRYSHQGSYSADIQDNSGTSSSFYHSNGLDVSGYTDLEVEFWYKPISMDKPGEDFWVQYWDGSTWRTVAVFDKGTDFENGNYYNVVVSIPAGTYNYPTNAKLKFVCDASGNADDVYIDEIEFRGFQ